MFKLISLAVLGVVAFAQITPIPGGGGGGGGVGITWTPTRTSATALTLPAIAADTMAVGTYACPAIASGATFTVSSGTGSVWFALGSDCTVKARHNIVASCSTGCTAVSSSSGFDPSDLPLYQWSVTSGSLASTGTSKVIPNMSVALTAGTNVTISTTNGVSTISATSGTSFDPLDRTVAYLRDEFQPAIQNDAATPIVGQLAWMRQNNPTAAYSTTNLSQHHPGILRFTNSAAGASALDLGASSAALLANPTAYTNWEAQFTFRPLATANTTFRMGFYSAFATNPTDYYGLIFTGGTDTNWQVVMRAASGSTLTADSGVAVSTSNWYTMRVRSLVAGTVRVSFSTNGGAFSTEKTICASGCDVTGTMPTTVMTPFFYTYTSSGTTSVDIDWFGFNATGLTR